MEEFLTDYVKMYAECNDIKLNKNQIAEIVNNMMNEDEIWDTLESYITDYLDEE